ncbi:sulfatase-like hydrolase/transferase [Halorussus halophilus]|uniref:sulfatase-like hydrolase/transferase n=1 Tax=Halorussus halophilus TaxID=2650975 RepID=UPI0013015FC4|nr:sulfatase-like hydrolase/transferase [Halorussus halophilus]
MSGISDIDASNVFLYVGDAVRWDAVPESLSQRGTVFKTVAASIHTPTSFSSIVTGLQPPQHGVRQFGDCLSNTTPSLFTLEGVKSHFSNTINEKFNDNPKSESILDKTLATTESKPDDIDDAEPPFIFVERGRGGHAPYGDYPGNGWEYYRDRKDTSTSTYRTEYQTGVERDIEHFESQVEKLDERGLLEETLVIYTSDHGELLGEGGCVGHNTPIRPELAYVPTVFVHPDLKQKTVKSGVLRHVDFFPTLARLLGIQADGDGVPGRDIFSQPLADQGACFYDKSVVPELQPLISGRLRFESVWEADGGYVFPNSGQINRSVILAGKLLKSAKREYMRSRLWDVAKFYLTGVRSYDSPELTVSDARKYLDQLDALPKSESITQSTEVNEKQLRNLGYLS